LEIKADDYVAPEPIVSKVEEAKSINLSVENIAIIKAKKLKDKADKLLLDDKIK